MSMAVKEATGVFRRQLLRHLVKSSEAVRALTRRPPPAELSVPGLHRVIDNRPIGSPERVYSRPAVHCST
jgi:hypothetical protein